MLSQEQYVKDDGKSTEAKLCRISKNQLPLIWGRKYDNQTGGGATQSLHNLTGHTQEGTYCCCTTVRTSAEYSESPHWSPSARHRCSIPQCSVSCSSWRPENQSENQSVWPVAAKTSFTDRERCTIFFYFSNKQTNKHTEGVVAVLVQFFEFQ